MIKFEHTSVMNMENAIRGMRNPLQSWEKSDSWVCHEDCPHVLNNTEPVLCHNGDYDFCIVPNDLKLAQKLRNAGTDHRKFLRQIFVSVDITAPDYWFKEFSTYKVGTVENSTSTMHTIHRKPFDRSDFSCDHMTDHALAVLDYTILNLNLYRDSFLETNEKQHWYNIISSLPMNYNYLRTCTMNYEVLANMYHSRRFHKLEEWHTFCDWISELPYAKELILCE